MSKVTDYWFFNTFDETVGIVKVRDEITGEDRFYIGVADGIDEQRDIENIKSFGAPFFPDLIK